MHRLAAPNDTYCHSHINTYKTLSYIETLNWNSNAKTATHLHFPRWAAPIRVTRFARGFKLCEEHSENCDGCVVRLIALHFGHRPGFIQRGQSNYRERELGRSAQQFEPGAGQCRYHNLARYFDLEPYHRLQRSWLEQCQQRRLGYQ